MIERIYVQNFRCFESITIDFAGSRSALIIGKNGAGKSTFRKAMEVFQNICRGSSRVDNKLISVNDFSFRRTNRPMRFEIEVRLLQKQLKYAISFDWPEGFREARIEQESLSVDGEEIFGRSLAQVRLAGGATFGLDWHVFALPVIEERPPSKAISSLKSFLASLMLISPVPSDMTGYSEQPTVELGDDAANFTSCLRALLEKKPAAYTVLDQYLKSVIPDFSSLTNSDRGRDGKQLIVMLKRPESGDSLEVDFDALSDGEKCFFLCGFIIASNSADVPVFCFWDEPDNHLSISEVGHFITALRKMANRGGQFIATSHHPETIRKFSDENTYVLGRKSHLDPTLVTLLKDYSYNGDLIDALIRDEVVG